MTKQQTPETPYLDTLRSILQQAGRLRTVRISSAQAKGAAKKYCYWGAVRYVLRLSADGHGIIHAPIERATSDRRTRDGACRDAESLAAREHRVPCAVIGAITEAEAQAILSAARARGLWSSDTGVAVSAWISRPADRRTTPLDDYGQDEADGAACRAMATALAVTTRREDVR